MSRVNMHLVRFLIAICVLSSAFFYAPDVFASSNPFLDDDVEWVTVEKEVSFSGSMYGSNQLFFGESSGLPFHASFLFSKNLNDDLAEFFEEGLIYFIDSSEIDTTLGEVNSVSFDCSIGSAEAYGPPHYTFSFSDTAFKFDGTNVPITMKIDQNTVRTPVMYMDSFYAFAGSCSLNCSTTVRFTYCCITQDRYENYIAGYNAGFEAGEDAGYDNGFTSGFEKGEVSGYDSGFEAGKDAGYDAGYDSGFEAGEDAGYDSGFEAGEDAGYDVGFEAGVSSVDTDLFFEAGYNQGLNNGYSEGYDDGYSKGYSEAFSSSSTSNSTLLVAGTSKTYSFSQTVEESLSFKSANTPFSNLVYDSGGTGESFSIVDLEGYWYEDGDLSYGGSIESDFEYQPYFRGYSYNMSSIKSLFKASPDVYAYKIILKPVNVALETDSVYWLRTMFGTYSDVQACSGEYGHLIVDGSTQNSSVWLVTDYSDIYICLGYLSYFQHSYHGNASYSLDWNFDIEVIPYTKNEYNAAVPAIEKQTLELQKQTEAFKQEINNLKNGYDHSSADKMNDDFSSSLTDYQITEDSLFNSAKGGLDSFTFVDFASYPSLVTSMSFTTSLMTAVYNAMGGNSGPFGIVLSILFSVMLVAMVIGLSRFFKSDGKGDD